jgi:hypothetical protein
VCDHEKNLSGVQGCVVQCCCKVGHTVLSSSAVSFAQDLQPKEPLHNTPTTAGQVHTLLHCSWLLGVFAGHILLRDFRRGEPRPQHVQPYCSNNAAAAAAAAASDSSSAGISISISNSDAVCEAGLTREAAAAAAAIAAGGGLAPGVGSQQLTKFWRV